MIVSRELLKYSGRFDFTEEKGPRFAWPKTSITINFEGDKLSAELESERLDYFLVVLDGRIHINCLPVKNRKLYTLVEDIDYGNHTVELVKNTESYISTATFYGFELHKGNLLEREEDSNLKIEIFGDSITCGYGVEAENEDSPYEDINANSYLAYGSIAARDLKADIHLTAWSGLGLVRNYDDIERPLPERIEWITPQNEERLWNFNSYTPNIVVINLGTNDFNGFTPTRESYVNGYRTLIKRIRGYYGKDIKIICSLGPAIDGKNLIDLREYIGFGVVDYFNIKGDKNIYFLEYETQKEENGYAQAYHPSALTHALMAKELKNKINEILNR